MDDRDLGTTRQRNTGFAARLAAALAVIAACALPAGCANARGTDRPILQEQPGSVYPAPAGGGSAASQAV
ncbi:MAG: hypothetical protein ACKO0W_06005 [Planctomycetota bacterium]